MSAIRVLSASVDPLLNNSRALFLRRYGFAVTTSSSKEQARKVLNSAVYDILIFGSTLPADACCELAEVFRTRNSRGKIIEVLTSHTSVPKNRPDAVVASADDPVKIVSTIYSQFS